jgi:hypothetical protein
MIDTYEITRRELLAWINGPSSTETTDTTHDHSMDHFTIAPILQCLCGCCQTNSIMHFDSIYAINLKKKKLLKWACIYRL